MPDCMKEEIHSSECPGYHRNKSILIHWHAFYNTSSTPGAWFEVDIGQDHQRSTGRLGIVHRATSHGYAGQCSPCSSFCSPSLWLTGSIFFVQISFFWLRTSALTKRNENMIDHAPSTFVEAQRHNKYCLHYMISKQHVYMQTNKYNNVSASCSLHTKGMKHPGKAHGAVVFSTWIMFLPVVVASHECVR